MKGLINVVCTGALLGGLAFFGLSQIPETVEPEVNHAHADESAASVPQDFVSLGEHNALAQRVAAVEKNQCNCQTDKETAKLPIYNPPGYKPPVPVETPKTESRQNCSSDSCSVSRSGGTTYYSSGSRGWFPRLRSRRGR